MYSSELLITLFQNDALISPVSEVLHFKKNLLGGTTLADGNGNVVLETMPGAGGWETVTFANGETAHLTENIYGSATLDFTGTANDIVMMPSIFDSTTVHQGGQVIGTIEPNFMGDGYDLTSAAGETLFSTTPDVFAGTAVTISTPFDVGSHASLFDIQNSFSEIETISSQISLVDLGTATDAVDGLDFLDLF